MKNIYILSILVLFLSLSLVAQDVDGYFRNNETVTDYDGNVYQIVEIGGQIWTNKNLKSLHYADGTEITEVWSYDDDDSYVETYGRLYTWDAAMNYSNIEASQGVCPDGWHVPTDAEWTTLGNYLGGNNIAGGKMKSTGTEFWQSPNTGATNESGFTALPAGEYDDTHYQLLYQYAVIWSSTETSSSKCKYRYLAYNDAELHPYNYFKDFRYSVRCLKDESINVNESIPNKSEIKLQPNPAGDFIEINIEGNDKLDHIEIYNEMGQLVASRSNKVSPFKLPIFMLPKGVYVIRVKQKGSVNSQRFIKQ